MLCWGSAGRQAGLPVPQLPSPPQQPRRGRRTRGWVARGDSAICHAFRAARRCWSQPWAGAWSFADVSHAPRLFSPLFGNVKDYFVGKTDCLMNRRCWEIIGISVWIAIGEGSWVGRGADKILISLELRGLQAPSAALGVCEPGCPLGTLSFTGRTFLGGCSGTSRCCPQAVSAALSPTIPCGRGPCPLPGPPRWAPPTAGSSGGPPPPRRLPLILSPAKTCALTLLAGFQLFYFQVMGELWKRNQTGVRRSIPPVPRAPRVSPCSPPGCWPSPWLRRCLCPAHGVSGAISEHRPQAETKPD